MSHTLQFVVQHHQGYGPEHWDLMLEETEALITWQLHRDPATLSAGSIRATQIGDHRKVYLHYEGPVRGNRGTVRIVDAGTYTVLGAEATRRTIAFDGRVLSGRCTLVRDAADERSWAFTADA